MKIKFRAGKIPNIIHFLPYIKIRKSEFATDWKRFALELGFLFWAIGCFFAIRRYCDECGAYFKDECMCDDDRLDLGDDDEYED